MMLLNLFAILLFTYYFCPSNGAETPKSKLCNSVNRADTCMQRLLLLGDPKFIFPENKEQMNDHCKKVTATEKCIKDYSNKCLDTFPRQVTSVLAFGVAKTNKGYCSGAKRKDKFISIGTCGNKIKADGDKCMHQYIDTLSGVQKEKNNKMKVPMVCCNYFKLKKCILDLTLKDCTQEQSFEVERLVDGYAMEVLNLICGDYTEDSDKCDSVYGTEPKKSPAEKRPASLLQPFIKILSTV